ncbi:MAG: hypothetical protein ABIT71_19275 [Vicinamibacteraceae bacterium]
MVLASTIGWLVVMLETHEKDLARHDGQGPEASDIAAEVQERPPEADWFNRRRSGVPLVVYRGAVAPRRTEGR